MDYGTVNNDNLEPGEGDKLAIIDGKDERSVITINEILNKLGYGRLQAIGIVISSKLYMHI